MFPNLDAEQARTRTTNQMAADYLGISRVSFENKKKTKKFNVMEAKRLCQLFGVPFDYLFESEVELEAADV